VGGAVRRIGCQGEHEAEFALQHDDIAVLVVVAE
jgi:hypothetical protein